MGRDDANDRVHMLKEAGNLLHAGHPKYPLKKVAKVMESLENFLPETGELAYLAYMAERLAFCRELLKDTGSIYLHCVPTMSHYLKKNKKILDFFSWLFLNFVLI